MAEANEPPTLALAREIVEELDMAVPVGRLLALDWIGPHGPWDDQLVFVFDAGILTDDQVDNLKTVDRELSELGFFTVHEAKQRLRNDVADRLERAVSALAARRTDYVEESDRAD